MRIYGLLDTDDYGYYLITTITTDPNYLNGNIYYIDKDVACVYNIYNSNQMDWFPWNCDIIENNMFFKDGKYYDERDELEDSVEGARISKYKEGKLVKQYFKPY